eukprot:TRINITY_DN154_c0_g2_i1.p1 TRINITY_DN154_c0_g2~~TRINITY_DN154_c0_g2_i1.p1  ORF type:complete len:438 (-),score=102.92 TRINITY_DN154_c0_g2_i1:641-1954(-)
MADEENVHKQASSITTPLVGESNVVPSTSTFTRFKAKLVDTFFTTVGYMHGPPDEREKYKELSDEELEALYRESGEEDDAKLLKKFHYTAPPTAEFDSDKPFETLMRFTGTGLDLVTRRLDFWLLLLLHVSVTIAFSAMHGTPVGGVPDLPGWPKISIAYISVPSSIIIFTLTFYVNQMYARYQEQSGHAGGAGGTLGDLLMLLRVHMSDGAFREAKAVRYELVKFMNALHFLGFAGMEQNRCMFKTGSWCWYFLKKKKLLTPAQVEDLKPLINKDGTNGSLAYKEVVLWVTRGIWAQVANGNLDPKVGTLFQEKLGVLRSHVDSLYGFISGPIPFAYFHLLLFMVNVYLLLLSYAFIFLAPWWSIPGFVIIEFAIMGMRELGNAMSNPFGCDSMDIPVFDKAFSFLKQSEVIVELPIEYPGELPELVLHPYKVVRE